MNLENLAHADFPFNHWVFSNCLEEGALNEISYSKIPSGDRMYDGTRAADHTGQGVDGKLRLFITKNNCQNFPYLKYGLEKERIHTNLLFLILIILLLLLTQPL